MHSLVIAVGTRYKRGPGKFLCENEGLASLLPLPHFHLKLTIANVRGMRNEMEWRKNDERTSLSMSDFFNRFKFHETRGNSFSESLSRANHRFRSIVSQLQFLPNVIVLHGFYLCFIPTRFYVKFSASWQKLSRTNDIIDRERERERERERSERGIRKGRGNVRYGPCGTW